jgi:small subunit ribosomal protein S11
MGKKRIIKKTTEELVAERDAVDAAVRDAGVRGGGSRQAHVGRAHAYVLATWNNTIISITNMQGDVVAQSSAGAIGFRGAKKATPFAASRVAEAVAEKAKSLGINRVSVTVRGIGSGRESAVRSLASHGLDLLSIRDRTPIPHNGPRPPKPRRV